MNWNALEWDRAAEELTWERVSLMGLCNIPLHTQHSHTTHNRSPVEEVKENIPVGISVPVTIVLRGNTLKEKHPYGTHSTNLN